MDGNNRFMKSRLLFFCLVAVLSQGRVAAAPAGPPLCPPDLDMQDALLEPAALESIARLDADCRKLEEEIDTTRKDVRQTFTPPLRALQKPAWPKSWPKLRDKIEKFPEGIPPYPDRYIKLKEAPQGVDDGIETGLGKALHRIEIGGTSDIQSGKYPHSLLEEWHALVGKSGRSGAKPDKGLWPDLIHPLETSKDRNRREKADKLEATKNKLASFIHGVEGLGPKLAQLPPKSREAALSNLLRDGAAAKLKSNKSLGKNIVLDKHATDLYNAALPSSNSAAKLSTLFDADRTSRKLFDAIPAASAQRAGSARILRNGVAAPAQAAKSDLRATAPPKPDSKGTTKNRSKISELNQEAVPQFKESVLAAAAEVWPKDTKNPAKQKLLGLNLRKQFGDAVTEETRNGLEGFTLNIGGPNRMKRFIDFNGKFQIDTLHDTNGNLITITKKLQGDPEINTSSVKIYDPRTGIEKIGTVDAQQKIQIHSVRLKGTQHVPLFDDKGTWIGISLNLDKNGAIDEKSLKNLSLPGGGRLSELEAKQLAPFLAEFKSVQLQTPPRLFRGPDGKNQIVWQARIGQNQTLVTHTLHLDNTQGLVKQQHFTLDRIQHDQIEMFRGYDPYAGRWNIKESYKTSYHGDYQPTRGYFTNQGTEHSLSVWDPAQKSFVTIQSEKPQDANALDSWTRNMAWTLEHVSGFKEAGTITGFLADQGRDYGMSLSAGTAGLIATVSRNPDYAVYSAVTLYQTPAEASKPTAPLELMYTLQRKLGDQYSPYRSLWEEKYKRSLLESGTMDPRQLSQMNRPDFRISDEELGRFLISGGAGAGFGGAGREAAARAARSDSLAGKAGYLSLATAVELAEFTQQTLAFNAMGAAGSGLSKLTKTSRIARAGNVGFQIAQTGQSAYFQSLMLSQGLEGARAISHGDTVGIYAAAAQFAALAAMPQGNSKRAEKVKPWDFNAGEIGKELGTSSMLYGAAKKIPDLPKEARATWQQLGRDTRSIGGLYDRYIYERFQEAPSVEAARTPETSKVLAGEIDQKSRTVAREMTRAFKEQGINRKAANDLISLATEGFPAEGYHGAPHPLEVTIAKLQTLKKQKATRGDLVDVVAHLLHDSVGDVRTRVKDGVGQAPAVSETLRWLETPRIQEALRKMGLSQSEISDVGLLIENTYFSDIPAEREAWAKKFEARLAERYPDPVDRQKFKERALELADHDKGATYLGDPNTVISRLYGLKVEQGKSTIDLFNGTAWFLKNILAKDTAFQKRLALLGPEYQKNFTESVRLAERFEGIGNLAKELRTRTDGSGRPLPMEVIEIEVSRFFQERGLPRTAWLEAEIAAEIMRPHQPAGAVELAGQFRDYFDRAQKSGLVSGQDAMRQALDLFMETRNIYGLEGKPKIKSEVSDLMELWEAPAFYREGLKGRNIPEVKLKTVIGKGSSGKIFDATLDGEEVAVKVHGKPSDLLMQAGEGAAWAQDIRYFNNELKMTWEANKALGEEGLTPRLIGEVDIGSNGNPAFAVEKITGKTPDELSHSDLPGLDKTRILRQVARSVELLQKEGYGGSDSPQFMILTKPQIINGVARASGDIIAIDFGALKTDRRSWKNPRQHALEVAFELARVEDPLLSSDLNPAIKKRLWAQAEGLVDKALLDSR